MSSHAYYLRQIDVMEPKLNNVLLYIKHLSHMNIMHSNANLFLSVSK